MEGNETLCYNMFRMKNEVFHNLCQVLQHDYGLQHSRNIRLEESVAICLLILCHMEHVTEWFKKYFSIQVKP